MSSQTASPHIVAAHAGSQHNSESATAYVVAALEAKGTATRDDFDVDGIVAASHAIAESWDFDSLERTMFWNIAASHMKV
jgi:hypothetical protein